jgi:hypothetical protein
MNEVHDALSTDGGAERTTAASLRTLGEMRLFDR